MLFVKKMKCSLILRILPAILLIVAWGCEKRYTPVIEQKYQEILVVDGMISSRPGPYTVTLSMTSTMEDPRIIPQAGYRVEISDELGNSEVLTETAAGVYSTSPEGIQGVPGRKYMLELNSPSGVQYRSDFEELPHPVPVDSVYAEVEYISIDDFPYNLPGYQFYLDLRDIPADSVNFLWRLTETYKYQADHPLRFTYDGMLHPISNGDSLRTCYKTDPVHEIFLLGTAGLSSSNISRIPLNFVGTDNRRLDMRYSLLAEQYCISDKAFTYWKTIRELSVESGEMYTKMPFQVRGNISRVDQPEVPVYGYFMTAGLTGKRIFVNRPRPPVEMYFSKCVLTDSDFRNYGMMFLGKPPSPDDPNLITETPQGQRAWPLPSCVDCRAKGGRLEKPDFWID